MTSPDLKAYRVTLEVHQTYSVIVDATEPKDAAAKGMVDAAARLPAVDGLKNDPGTEQMGRTTRAVFVEVEHNDPRPKIRN